MYSPVKTEEKNRILFFEYNITASTILYTSS